MDQCIKHPFWIQVKTDSGWRDVAGRSTYNEAEIDSCREAASYEGAVAVRVIEVRLVIPVKR